jgi:hypothetical protein
MTDDIEEQFAAHIREILHIALDVKVMTLRKLNELAGQTSKLKHQSITNRQLTSQWSKTIMSRWAKEKILPFLYVFNYTPPQIRSAIRKESQVL